MTTDSFDKLAISRYISDASADDLTSLMHKTGGDNFKNNHNTMTATNQSILTKANEAIAKGNYEEFLQYCTDDTKWTFVGDQVLTGKEAVRIWMSNE